jgi:hypothetical protein
MFFLTTPYVLLQFGFFFRESSSVTARIDLEDVFYQGFYTITNTFMRRRSRKRRSRKRRSRKRRGRSRD